MRLPIEINKTNFLFIISDGNIVCGVLLFNSFSLPLAISQAGCLRTHGRLVLLSPYLRFALKTHLKILSTLHDSIPLRVSSPQTQIPEFRTLTVSAPQVCYTEVGNRQRYSEEETDKGA